MIQATIIASTCVCNPNVIDISRVICMLSDELKLHQCMHALMLLHAAVCASAPSGKCTLILHLTRITVARMRIWVAGGLFMHSPHPLTHIGQVINERIVTFRKMASPHVAALCCLILLIGEIIRAWQGFY